MSLPAIHSDAIAEIVQLAIIDGNEVSEISEGWTRVRQVVHMKRPISTSLKGLILQSTLRYWSADPTPHNSAEEGFTDDVEKVAVSFPR